MSQLLKRKVDAECSRVEVVGRHEKLQRDLRFDLELGNVLFAAKHVPESRVQQCEDKKNQGQVHPGLKAVATNDVFCHIAST